MAASPVRLARPSGSVIACFFAHASEPAPAQLRWLAQHHGVPGDVLEGALLDGLPIGAAAVRFGRRWFDFAAAGEEGARAGLVLVAGDRVGWPLDLVAWCPRTGETATHFGRAVLLGEQDLLAPRAAGPVPLHRAVPGWLRAGRRGVVILDRRQAWRALDGIRIAAEDLDHGIELRSLLTPPAPTVVVPAAAPVVSETRAAA